jgi:hypothetical protein
MPHTITIPINENGIIIDADMSRVIGDAIAEDPFGFQDVYVYSHGWSTDAARALGEYNRFSIGFSIQNVEFGRVVPAIFKNPPRDALAVGIHWPSEITEDENSPLNVLQQLTFYTMEHRADTVGKNGLYTILRLMLQARSNAGQPLRFNLLGHSFGCKVICAALQDVAVDIENKTIPLPAGTTINAALLQAATDNDNLETGDIYGKIAQLPVRLLLTKSNQDLALTKWYAVAGKLANILHAPPPALGADGPTAATTAAFGGADNIDVPLGFKPIDLRGLNNRMLVANLSPAHQARSQYSGGFAGHHSDINFSEVYQLVGGFFFGIA